MGKDATLTDDDINAAGLTDEELAALNEEDDVPAADAATGEDDAPASAAPEDEADGEEPAAASAAPAKPDDGVATPAAEDATAAAEPPAAADEPEAPESPPTSPAEPGPARYSVADTATQQERISAIDTRLREMVQAVDAGDMTYSESKDEEYRLLAERQELVADVRAAKLIEQINQESTAHSWEAAQDAFFARPDNQVFASDDGLREELQITMDVLGRMGKLEGMSYAQMLDTAAARVRPTSAGPAPTADAPAAPAAPSAKAGKKPQPQFPQTLGDVPAAGEIDDYGNEFANIDRLDGIEQEEALAHLSPDQLNRYLSR